jgi:hypothetical protein
MKRFLYLLIAASMLFAYGCTGDNTTITTPTGSDTLNGTLRDCSTNKPIAGALIKNGLNATVTDATGNWTLGGFSETTAVTGSVAPMFMISITKLPSGYPSQVFRTVGVTQSVLGPNDLTVGKTNATVTGQVLNADGTVAVGAQVWLSYLTDGHSGTLSLSAIGTAFSTTPAVTTDANGKFAITGIETGAIIFPTAQSADGKFTRALAYAIADGNVRQLSIIDAFTTNLTVMQFAGTQDTKQRLTVTSGATTATVGVFGVDPAVVIQNSVGSEFAPGNTTVAFNLTRPAQATAYTATNFVGGQLWQDVNVNFAAKTGNIPYTVDFTTLADGTITQILVHFTTAVSGIYTVDVNAVIPKLLDTEGANGILLNGTTQVVFTTNGGVTNLAAVGHLTLASLAGGNFSYTWLPVSGAVRYHVYAQAVENFLDGTSNVHAFVLTGNVTTAAFTFSPGVSLPVIPATFDPFTENDGIRLSYNLTVVAVNSDGLEGPAQAAADVVSINNLPATVAAVAVDLTTGANLQPAADIVTNLVTFNEINVTTASAPPAVGQVALGAIIGTQPAIPAATALVGGFTNAPTHTASLVRTIHFTKALVKTQVETLLNWSIVDVGTVTPATTVPIVNAIGGTTVATVDVSTKSIASVQYNSATRTATVTYSLGYSFSTPAADAAGTTYTVTNPLFFFKTTAKDLAGNSVFTGNLKGF